MTNRSPWPLCQVSALIAQQKMVAEQRPSSEAALREGVNCADSMTSLSEARRSLSLSLLRCKRLSLCSSVSISTLERQLVLSAESMIMPLLSV